MNDTIKRLEKVLRNSVAYQLLMERTAQSIKTKQDPNRWVPWTPDTWPKSRGNSDALKRLKQWAASEGTLFLFFKHPNSTCYDLKTARGEKVRILSPQDALDVVCRDDEDLDQLVPVFPNILMDLRVPEESQDIRYTENKNIGITASEMIAAQIIPTKQEKKEMFNTKNATVDSIVNANKTAVKLAGKLSVGKAANLTLLRKVTVKFPWYAKLFGKAKELETNPIAKLASAEIVMALSKHFAPENDKLRYLSEAMLEEAMVDVVTNSTQLESLINELTDLVPSDLFEAKTK